MTLWHSHPTEAQVQPYVLCQCKLRLSCYPRRLLVCGCFFIAENIWNSTDLDCGLWGLEDGSGGLIVFRVRGDVG